MNTENTQSIEKDWFTFKVSIEIQTQYSELVKLVLNTESMDNNEKQYWFDMLPSMTDEQIDRLFDILEKEMRKLEELEIKYQEEIKALNEKHLKEWEEFNTVTWNQDRPDLPQLNDWNADRILAMLDDF